MSDDINRPWYNYWPEGVPKHINYQEIALGDVLRNTAEEFPNSQAIFFQGYRITYQELDASVDQFATGLSKIGVKKGDVVAIDLPNIPQFIIAFYATARLGAIYQTYLNLS